MCFAYKILYLLKPGQFADIFDCSHSIYRMRKVKKNYCAYCFALNVQFGTI